MKKILYIVLTICCFTFICDVSAYSIDNIYFLVGTESSSLTCSNPDLLRMLLMVKTGMSLITIITPIILIIMLMLDGFKSIMSEDGMDKKFIGKSTKKLLAAVIIFLTPAIINFVLSIVGQAGYDKAKCWSQATEAGIQKAEAAEAAAIAAKKAADEKAKQDANNKYSGGSGETTTRPGITINPDTLHDDTPLLGAVGCYYDSLGARLADGKNHAIWVAPSANNGIAVEGANGNFYNSEINKSDFYVGNEFTCAKRLYVCAKTTVTGASYFSPVYSQPGHCITVNDNSNILEDDPTIEDALSEYRKTESYANEKKKQKELEDILSNFDSGN